MFKISLKEGDKTKWARSLNSAKKINNDIAKKIIKWRWLSAQMDTQTRNPKRFYLKIIIGLKKQNKEKLNQK